MRVQCLDCIIRWTHCKRVSEDPTHGSAGHSAKSWLRQLTPAWCCNVSHALVPPSLQRSMHQTWLARCTMVARPDQGRHSETQQAHSDCGHHARHAQCPACLGLLCLIAFAAIAAHELLCTWKATPHLASRHVVQLPRACWAIAVPHCVVPPQSHQGQSLLAVSFVTSMWNQTPAGLHCLSSCAMRHVLSCRIGMHHRVPPLPAAYRDGQLLLSSECHFALFSCLSARPVLAPPMSCAGHAAHAQ